METLNVIYILDENGKLLEDVRLGSLVLADPQTLVTAIADPPLVSLLATEDPNVLLSCSKNPRGSSRHRRLRKHARYRYGR